MLSHRSKPLKGLRIVKDFQMNLWINECPAKVKVCVRGTTPYLPIPSLKTATPHSVSMSKGRGGPHSHIELYRNVLYVCLLRP